MKAEDLQKLWEKTVPPDSWDAAAANVTHRPSDDSDAAHHPTWSTLSGVSGDEAAGEAPSAELLGYDLLEEIGRGGMGVVYRARQRSLERDVAVKRMIDRSSASHRRRFVAEALVTGALDHPNVVPVHDLGRTSDGDVFLSMKLSGGVTWADLLHPHTLAAIERAARYDLLGHLGILLSVCNAIAYAHSRDILHRDIKPENVMIGEFGEVLVMDWGLAVDTRDDAPATSRKTITRSSITAPSGTPAYMPPEMAEARAQDIGPRSDVFLLGAVLHEILTGRPPNAGDKLMAVLVAASRCEPATFGPNVPAGLGDICRKAMSRDPKDRYPTVRALQDAISAWLRHRESLAITDAAIATLARCEPAAQDLTVPRDAVYADFAEAVAGLRQAQLLWAENAAASALERRARAAYAEAALAAGDLGLAAAQATDPELQARIAEAQQRRLAEARTATWLRYGLAAATAVIVVGLAGGFLAVRAEKQRADAALVEILRLADARRLADLHEQADALWPSRPENAQGLRDWLTEARELTARLPEHEATLEALRLRALPYDNVAKEHDRTTHPAYADLLGLQAQRAEKDRRGVDLGDLPAQIAALETARSERRTWVLPDDELQWEHDTMAALVAGLKQLTGSDPAALTISGVEARLRTAETVQSETIDSRKADWDAAIAAIAASPKYGGLKLAPQLGLVPLGADPKSGLHEFADPETGSIPTRGADGRLILAEDAGIVFVLLPGGTFRMGSVAKGAPGETNLDPDALDDEIPVHDVTLAPFFLSKYETTQGQWQHVMGVNPSSYPPGTDYGGKVVTLLNPLENVSWDEATAFADRLGLLLPTEAQWEYGARGGTTTPYWTGQGLRSIDGAMNVADVFAMNNGGIATGAYELWLDDGYRVHSPVNALLANGFGLHDTGGNVLEWCRDRYGSYENQARPGDGERAGDESARVHRGGNWFNTGSSGRSAIRDADSGDSKWDSLGFRASRAVSVP